jgi:LysR family glycine cleavage system transcriptional activator
MRLRELATKPESSSMTLRGRAGGHEGSDGPPPAAGDTLPERSAGAPVYRDGSGMVPRRIPSLNALRAFEAAARHLTLGEASDELCVTTSAIGQQIRQLENWLGMPLYEMKGRSRRLTAAGERLASHMSNAFDQIYIACQQFRRASQVTELHVNVSPTFAIRWLVPRLPGFQVTYPNISIRISTSKKPIDVARENVHADLRFGRGPWLGLAADLLFMEDIFPVCNPKLLSGPGALTHPAALKHHVLLHTAVRRDDWARWLKAAGLDLSEVDPSRGPVFELNTMAIDAAEAGLGVAITRTAHLGNSLREGSLVAPFRCDLLRGEGFYMVTLPELREEPNIAAFRGWLLKEASRQTEERQTETRSVSIL